MRPFPFRVRLRSRLGRRERPEPAPAAVSEEHLAEGDGDGSPVSERFQAAWTSGSESEATPELLPMRLAQACVRVLPVAAAGISLFDREFRVPLGASDRTAAAAERLQFTHGSGPCLEAATRQVALFVKLEQMTRRWPAFAAEFAQQSPYASILSVPLHVSSTISGALDLYFTAEQDPAGLVLTDVMTVVSQITDTLLSTQAARPAVDELGDGEARPAWLFGPPARGRTQVWIALGMVIVARDVDAADALALLRAHAYSRSVTVDDVAADMVEGRLTAEDVAA